MNFEIGNKVMLLPNVDEVRAQVFNTGDPEILLPNLAFDIQRHYLTIERFEDKLSPVRCAVLKGGRLKDGNPITAFLIPLKCITHPTFLNQMMIRLPYLYE